MRTPWLFLALAACNTTPTIPWVHGMDNVVSSTGVLESAAPFDSEVAPRCGVAASRPIELVANVAPASGRETVVASYSGGIAVYDREDHLLMETPGYACEGSYDELDVVATGSIYGTPSLAIVATSGGRYETSTWVTLFRIDRTLEATFTGVVETRVGSHIERGAIYLFRGGLLHQHPGGKATVWRLHPGSKIYVPLVPEWPHGEPDLRVSQR